MSKLWERFPGVSLSDWLLTFCGPIKRQWTLQTRSSVCATEMASREAVRQLVQKLITGNKVMVFSKSYCPFCMQAKSVLRQAGIKDMKVLELEQRADGSAIQEVVKEMTGNTTVPSVFINHKFMGGSSDVQDKYDSGELTKLLQQAGIIDAKS